MMTVRAELILPIATWIVVETREGIGGIAMGIGILELLFAGGAFDEAYFLPHLI